MAVVTETLSAGGVTVTASKTLSPSDQVLVIGGPFTVATAETDKQLAVGGVDVSQLVACYVHSTAAVTLETNANDASGGNTLTLAADVAYVWCTGKPDSCKFTADITTMYCTNASGSSATINMIFVQDGTP